MEMEGIKGRIVGIVLNNCRGLDMAGHDQSVHKTSFFARVVGYDVFGLWVESRYKEVRTHVYFPWSNIKSIVFFPEKNDIDNEQTHTCLGFSCDTAEAKKAHKRHVKPKHKRKGSTKKVLVGAHRNGTRT